MSRNVDIVQAVLKKYRSLPKGGKPLVHEKKAEWTVLASIVMSKHVDLQKKKRKF